MKILGIRSPLASECIYVQIEEDEPIDKVLQKTVCGLEEVGDNASASQLSRLIQDHHPFLKGQRLDASQSVYELEFTPRVLEGQEIEFAEISLLKAHVGGHDR